MQQDKDQFQDSLTSERRPKAKDATDRETARAQADALPSLNASRAMMVDAGRIAATARADIGVRFEARPIIVRLGLRTDM
jgi:hypothetical protein